MNKVISPKKTIGRAWLNVKRLADAKATAGSTPGRPAIAELHLPRFA